MSTGQITGQRVHTSDISRIGRVCAWLPANNVRAYALVEMEDDGTFVLEESDRLVRVAERVTVFGKSGPMVDAMAELL
jgi:hypothetical protein